MPVILDKSLGLNVKPESIAPFKNELAEEAMAGLREDIPGIEFGAAPTQSALPTDAASATPRDPKWQTLTFAPRETPPPPAPVPEVQEAKRGFAHNLVRKVGDRAGKLLSNMTFGTADTVADLAPEWLDAGIVFDDKGIRLAKGGEYSEASLVSRVADVMRDPDRKLIDHKDTRTFKDIKDSYKAGDTGKMAGDMAIFALENGIASVPDMIGIVAAAPAYFTGLASEYAQSRATNDGRDKPTLEDAAIGTGTALVVGALEKYGADRVLGMIGNGNKRQLRRFFETVAAETLTEAAQNPAEFTGERVGTAAQGQITPAALAEQSAAGALGGLGGGAVVGGTVQGIQALASQPPAQSGAPLPPAPAAAPPPAAQTTPAAAATAGSPPATPQSQPGPVVPGGVTMYQPQGAAGPTPVRVNEISQDGQIATVTSLDENGDPVIVDGAPATYPVQITDLGAPKTTATNKAAPQVQPPAAVPTEQERMENRSAAYKLAQSHEEGGRPAGEQVIHWQQKTDEAGQPMGLWRAPSGTFGLVPLTHNGGKSPLVNGVLVAKFWPAAVLATQTTPNIVVGPLTPPQDGSKQEQAIGPNLVAQRNATAPTNAAGQPDVPSAEPVRDIEAQIADLVNPESTRKGVFLSHENVKNLRGLKALDKVLTHPHVKNFDYRGGIMLFPNAESAAAVDAQRKGKKGPELQALIGVLTGAGVNKPAGPAVVVQQTTPDGAVTRESLVAPAQIQAASTAMAEPGRTVQVVTPEQAQARRAEGVAADNATLPASAVPPTAVPAAAATSQAAVVAPSTTAAPVSRAIPRAKPKGTGLRGAMTFIQEQERVPAGKKLAAPLEQRQQNAALLAQALKQATAAAAKRGAPQEVIAAANKAVHAVSTLADKSEYETLKGRGTDHAKITSKINDLMAAAEAIAQHEEQQEPAKGVEGAPREPAGDAKAKAGSKKQKVVVTPTMKAKAYVAEDADAIEKAGQRETVEVEPRAVEGRELAGFLSSDVGLDVDAIKASAGSKRKARGILAREAESLLPQLNKKGSWLQRMAALRTTDQLSDGAKNKIWKAALKFAQADKADADAAFRELTEQLNDLEGKALGPQTISAVHEYAQFLRAFESLRDRVDEMEGDQLVDDTDVVEDEPPNDYDDGREYTTPPGAKVRNTNGLNKLADSVEKFYQRVVDTFRDTGRPVSAHDFLKELRKGADATDTYFGQLIDRLLSHAPDVPVFLEKNIGTDKGYAYYQTQKGEIHITAPDFNEGMSAYWVAALLHEITHAATSHEIRNHPEGKLAKKLESLRRQALVLAMGKYGGDVKTKGKLYGLTNTLELVAEVFTNPQFQSELLSFGARHPREPGPVRTNFLHRVYGAVKEFLGIKNPREGWLLQDILDTSAEVMRAQAQRVQTYRAKLDSAAAEFAQIFGVDKNTAVERLREITPAPTAAIYDKGAAATPIQEILFAELPPEAGPPIHNEANVRALAGAAATTIARATRNAGKSRVVEKIRKAYLSSYTFDQIERRMSRFFGVEGAGNALTRLMDVRRRRQSHANVLLERAERDVNAKWLKLTKAQSKQLGQAMIDATLWQIDPSIAKDKQVQKVGKRKDFDKRYEQVHAQWRAMTPLQREIFESARDFNTHMFNKIRRAAVDLALDGYTENEVNKAQRSLLYALRGPVEVDALVGEGKQIDLAELNEPFTKVLKDVLRVTSVEGPYFSLRRHGDKVVQANKEGEETFATQDAAKNRAEEIKAMTPANKATVKSVDGKFVVTYKMNYVSFHQSRGEAEADAERMRASGFGVEAVTEKTTSTATQALTPALQELLATASRKMGGEGDGKEAVKSALENAFLHILAERAASMGSQLKRDNVAGVKAEEMHIGFAERTHSTAWHYANMITAKDEVRSLTNLRQYARRADMGNADQATMYQRGLVTNEVERRIAIEASEFGQAGPVDTFLGKIGFAGYLLTPSYTFVNAMQNFTVAMPVIGAKYGYGRTSKVFARAMRAVSGPAFAKAFRGMASKPGQVTSYDIYQSIATALADDPRLAKWVQGDNSAIKQLVDLGVINASFTQELMSVAQGESQTVRKTMEYARLMPQGAEMFNRISTALAALELTKGDVNKTADLVRLTQIDYSQANQPRAFRRIGRVSLPRSLTMFKMYPQAIYNLILGSAYDAITGAGAPRAEAAKTLAGILLSHTVLAGVVRGLLLEPLRMVLWAWNQIFGDDDEQYDLDTSVRLWLADTFGKEAGDVLSRGIFAAAGLDLSSRLGLSHLALYNTPTAADEDSWYKMIAEALGPIPSLIVRNITGFTKAWEQGRYRDAVAAAIPLKILQDTNKAYNQATQGITTNSGAAILEGKDIGGLQTVATALGFKTTQSSQISDKRSTKYDYEQWLSRRKSQLYGFYWNAADPEERRKAVGAIKQFNEKNPGARIRKEDLIKSRRTAKQQAAQARGEKIRNKDLQERMDY